MDGIVIALIVIFAVIAVAFLALAIYHFAAAKKEDPTEEKPEREQQEAVIAPVREPEPVKPEKTDNATDVEKIVERASQRYRENSANRNEADAPQPQAAPEPQPSSPLAAELEKELDPDGQYVLLQQTEKPTLREEYSALPKNKKKLFDKIVEEMTALEKARVKEAKFSITAMQGQDMIAKLKIVRGEIILECTVINPELKLFGKETGKKIKPKPNKFKLDDPLELEPALFTLRLANKTSLDARTEKKPDKSEEK